MLNLLYKTTVSLDRVLSTDHERRAAGNRARHARLVYGDTAIDHLLDKLRHPRRRRSRREIRLAIAALIAA